MPSAPMNYTSSMTGSPTPELPKSDAYADTVDVLPKSISNAPREMHQKLRRAMSHAFSAASLREHEGIVNGYVSRCMSGLHQACANGDGAVDMISWFTWTTFDIAGDLTLGQSFDCLTKGEVHPWIEFFLGVFYMNAFMISLKYVGLNLLVSLIFRVGGMISQSSLRKSKNDMVRARLNLGYDPNDLF
ncbi:cytochrome P450 (isotrichodermin C-15 hydroxylase) [Colletotrichum tabaci]|uniref:Cytochrome P450 (Isotrichodermin C-15 hydroxylase) n=1 Tax=Colletotrichum tabaci TaxID=1209068 RepID=A0AAV9TV00_9PEZI